VRACVGGIARVLGRPLLAARNYPSEYDWRYMTISSLVYPDRNPDGYRWAWRGLMLCALGGLSWTAVMLRDSGRDGRGRTGVGVWALGVGYVCMVSGAWLPAWLPGCRGPRSAGPVVIPRFVRRHRGPDLSAHRGDVSTPTRRAQSSLALRLAARRLALSPILLAALTQAYVSYALPDLPWVGLAWRARGAPMF